MSIIILTIAGALLLIWGGMLGMLKWVSPIERKHLLGYAGYVTVVCGTLVGLVLHTYTTQQDAAFASTRARLDQELGRFQNQLGDLTGRLMGQLAEKAELTQSEYEVRGNLQSERATHEQTRKTLARVREELEASATRLTQRTNAYVDSLATERARLAETQQQLAQTLRELEQTRTSLSQTRTERDRAQERLASAERDVKRLDAELADARRRSEDTTKMLAELQKQLQQESVLQEKTLYTLQAAVDSVYLKVMKRPRVPGPAQD